MHASDGAQTLCAECGRRLRARREALGLLQKDVAVAVGRSRPRLGRRSAGRTGWLPMCSSPIVALWSCPTISCCRGRLTRYWDSSGRGS